MCNLKDLRMSDDIIDSICEKIEPANKGLVLAELKELVKAVKIETSKQFKNGSDMLYEKITKNL
jgi:hypothetical protein